MLGIPLNMHGGCLEGRRPLIARAVNREFRMGQDAARERRVPSRSLETHFKDAFLRALLSPMAAVHEPKKRGFNPRHSGHGKGSNKSLCRDCWVSDGRRVRLVDDNGVRSWDIVYTYSRKIIDTSRMTWTEKMKQKQSFVEAYKSGHFSMTELCERHGVSRQTGHKLWRRYQAEGGEALKERSRAPHRCPHRMAEVTRSLLLEAKKVEPRWGAPLLRRWLVNTHGLADAPAVSTIHRFLESEGLVKHRRRRRKSKHPGMSQMKEDEPNETWTTDFKGQFPTQDGVLCYPLTVVDQHSRYILEVRGLPSVKEAGVIPVFEELFRRYGLPKAIRSDNGVPFCTVALHGLSKLNVWWTKLGIERSRMDPGSPQQNGAHERMHRTLKQDTILPPKRNMRAQQRRFDEWRHRFNNERPHQYLEGATPSSRWKPSPRPFPTKLRGPEYPGEYLPRHVSTAGVIRLKSKQIFVSHLLAGDYVGLHEVHNGLWDIHFYGTVLGRLDERTWKIIS